MHKTFRHFSPNEMDESDIQSRWNSVGFDSSNCVRFVGRFRSLLIAESEDIYRDLFSCLWLHIFIPLWFGFVSTDIPLFDSVIGYYIFFSVCSLYDVCADFSNALPLPISLSLFLFTLSKSSSGIGGHRRNTIAFKTLLSGVKSFRINAMPLYTNRLAIWGAPNPNTLNGGETIDAFQTQFFIWIKLSMTIVKLCGIGYWMLANTLCHKSVEETYNFVLNMLF